MKWTNGAVTSGDVAPQIVDDVTGWGVLRCSCVQAVVRLQTGAHIRQSSGRCVLLQPDRNILDRITYTITALGCKYGIQLGSPSCTGSTVHYGWIHRMHESNKQLTH